MQMIHSVRPPPLPMPMTSGQQSLLMNRPPPMPPSISMNAPSMHVPLPPASQFTPVLVPRPYAPIPVTQPNMLMMPQPPLPQGMPPPPPLEEALPPLLDELEPKRQKLDDYLLIPED